MLLPVGPEALLIHLQTATLPELRWRTSNHTLSLRMHRRDRLIHMRQY